MSEQREPKRARQACRNCRRKKTRCSGEKPICAFCARLGQECRYDDGHSPDLALSTSPRRDSVLIPGAHSPNPNQEANLAARVALLESRLSLLDSSSLNTLFGTQNPQQQSVSGAGAFGTGGPPAGGTADPSRKFSTLPDIEVIRAAADVYFQHCQNQPYCYSLESTFRQRLEEGSLPSYLLFSFLAISTRFSDHAFFENRHAEAIECYARLGWAEIFEQSFSEDHNVDIFTVQAANMLAVIDFVRGRHQLAWVKIGLSVRFAQSLRLGSEPDDLYSPCEQEERRRTFWSVYLLDKLVSPGRHRPPTLLDDDCNLRLPCSERDFREVSAADMPTLAALNEIPDDLPLQKGDHFALMVFMASVLGRIVRCNFQQTSSNSFALWDSRSEYAHTHGVLLSFESYSDTVDSSFAAALEHDFGSNGLIDYCVSGHFCFSHALYHLNHCLLHHPFLLRQRLRRQKLSKVPPSFLREAVQRSRDHAKHLTAVLQALQDSGCVAYPSFYGYCAMVAGVIHRLHVANQRGLNQKASTELYESCIRLLDHNAGPWDHYRRMSVALKSFQPSPSMATQLLSSSLSHSPLSSDETETMWNLVDYGWLSDSARPTSPSTDTSAPVNGPTGWTPFLEDTPPGTNGFATNWGSDEMIQDGNIEHSLLDAMIGNGTHADFNSGPSLSTAPWPTPLQAD